jgi:Tfp pilus assembly protein PilF
VSRHLPSLVLAVLVIAPGLSAAPPPPTSGDGEIYFNSGLTHLREGRPALALEQFKKAVKLDPKNPYALKGLGVTYLALNNYPEAIECFRKALEINPYYVDVHNDLGTALVLSGKVTEGIVEFTTAFNDPTNPTPEISALDLGQAYFAQKDYGQAATWYRASATKNKVYADAWLGLAEALFAMNRNDEAVSQLEEAAKAVPNQPCILAQLGRAYYQGGRFADARARLTDADQRQPSGACGDRARELLKQLPASPARR